MKLIKIQHDEIFPNGEWRYIANEKEKGKINDDLTYYYVDDDIDLDKLKEGEYISLDEKFLILEVEA